MALPRHPHGPAASVSEVLGGRCPRARWAAAVLILAVTAFRAAYLLLLCPYDLAPDEAHYWDWSRHLDWSYYSKGPLVAWIIRGACDVFGGLSLAADGTLMPAVRLPAVLCGSAILVGLYVLTYQTFGSDRLGLWVVAGALTLPAFSACSLIMTIDPPFLCCWTWALVFGRWALVDGRPWAWPAAGLLVALGILAKYTMALWLVSAGLFLLATPGFRPLLLRPGFWVMALVAGLSAFPILYWNSQHEWVTFRHVAVQAGVAESRKTTGFRWSGPLEYAAGQFVLLLGFWFLAWAGAVIRYRPRPKLPAGLTYLWWMSVPTFAVFAASSLRAPGQLNWPVAAYLSGAVLAAAWLADVWAGSGDAGRRWISRAIWGAFGFGLLLTGLAHDTRITSSLGARLAPPPKTEHPTPSRRLDPAGRLKGHRYLGENLDGIRSKVREAEGADPVLAGFRWDVPGLLGIYSDGHPQAYTLGLALGRDRHSQYDLWRPNPADDAQAFLGRTFLVVGSGLPTDELARAFDSVGPAREIVYHEGGRPVARWYVAVCRGFRGIDPAARRGAPERH